MRILFFLSWLASLTFAQAISPILYGQNSWMPTAYGTAVYNGSLDKLWGKIKDSHLRLIRVGGIAPDDNIPTHAQYLALVDSIKMIGAEPLVQISKNATVQATKDLITFLNITKARSVKYWNIGNEPDLHYSMTNPADVAAYFKPRATALKEIDPTIKIYGPDCAWYNTAILNGLIGGSSDITGKDANGNYYLDGVTWHDYADGTYTRDGVITTGPQKLRGNIANVKILINAANLKNGRTGESALKWGIGEFNMTYQNPANNTLEGQGVHSFINGQFWAEYFAIAALNGASYVAPWCIHESGGNRSTLDLGYLDNATTFNPRSSYYHLQMMSDYMNGTMVTATSTQAKVKAYSSKTDSTITVILLNQELTATLTYAVQLKTGMAAATQAMTVVANAGVTATLTGSLPPQYTRVIVFNAAGVAQKQIDFGMTQHAALNLPPSVTLLLPPSVPGEMIVNGNFDYGTTGWDNLYLGTTGQGTLAIQNATAVIATTATDGTSYRVQWVQGGLNLVQGKTYQLTFSAQSNIPASLVAGISKDATPWTSYGQDTVAVLSTLGQYALQFTMNAPSDPIGRLELNFGMAPATITLDNVSLKEIQLPTAVKKHSVSIRATAWGAVYSVDGRRVQMQNRRIVYLGQSIQQ
jgi:hypothetical protein